MKIITFLSTTAALINGQQRIVGGNEAAIGQHRYVSQLIACDNEDSSKCRPWCTGTLIAPNAILTAGSCVDDDLPFKWALVGSHYFDHINFSGADGIKVDVVKVIRHPRYNETSLTHDAALLILNQNISTIEPAQVSFEQVVPNTTTWARGWGQESFSRPYSPILLEVELKTWSRGNATKAYKELVPSYDMSPDFIMDYTKIAAGGEEGKDTCGEDIGGPLTIEASGSPDKLVGLASTGYMCGVKGVPGIYTRTQTLKSFLTWRCKTTSINCTVCNFAQCK
jgi:secreted trypsin-like serine protease